MGPIHDVYSIANGIQRHRALGAVCALQLCQELTLGIAGHRCTKVWPHARRERRDQASCKKYSIEKCQHPLKGIKKAKRIEHIE